MEIEKRCTQQTPDKIMMSMMNQPFAEKAASLK
jgi:hypothetical protein